MEMKALVVQSPGHAVIQEVPTPRPAANQLLIRVVCAGICGTDLAIYSGECSFVRDGSIRYPVRIGHEWAGEVVEVGAAVRDFRPGDRVICDNGVSCGVCADCRDGRYGDCRFGRSVGTIDCWDGCFAEYMLMPEYHAYHISERISYEAAAIIEPLSIAYEGFRKDALTAESTVAVIGSGPIGVSAVALAKYYGAGRIVCIARKDNKLEIAREIGATAVCNNTREDAVQRLLGLTDGRGADLVVETSGAEQGFRQAILMAKKYGHVAVIGFYERDIGSVPIDRLVIQSLEVFGAAGRFGNAEACRDLLERTDLGLEKMITHRVRFADMLEMLEHADRYSAERIKAMVYFD